MELNAKCFPFASSSPLRIHAGHHIDVLRHIVQVIVMRHPNPRTHLSLSEVQKSEYCHVKQWMSVDSKRNIYSSLSPVWKILMTNIFAMMTICHYLQIEKTTMLHATPPMRMQTSELTYNNRLGLKGHTQPPTTNRMCHRCKRPAERKNGALSPDAQNKVKHCTIFIW